MKIIVGACLALALLGGCGGSSKSAPTQTQAGATQAINPLVAKPIETGYGESEEAAAPSQAATGSYLTARQALATDIERSRTTRRRAVEAYVAGVAATCAGALKHAPLIGGKSGYVRQGSTLVLNPQAILFFDATGGVEQTMELVDAAATREFTRESRGLRWTDPAPRKLVNALADLEDARLERAMPMPELCRDAIAWVASGYRSLAARTTHAEERFGEAREVLNRELTKQGCVSPFPGRGVLHVLEQSMSRGQRTTAEEISRLEARVEDENAEIVNDAIAEIEKVLGNRLSVENGRPPRIKAGPACIAVPRAGRR